MLKTRKTGFSVIFLSLIFCFAVQATTVTVDMSSVANGKFGGNPDIANGNLFPTGQNTFNSVPFNIPSGPNNAWFGAYTGVQSGTETVDVHPNTFGSSVAYALINTMFVGETTPGAYLKLTFMGSAGAIYTYFMTQNVDYRDYNQSVNNTISGNASNAWNDIAIVGSTSWQRLDMLSIALPAAFRTQILTDVILTDDGSFGVQRSIWSGLSIAEDPEPATVVLFASGLALCCAWGRKRRRSL